MAKIVKPTRNEKIRIRRRLRAKYPQMFSPKWKARLGKAIQKDFETARTQQVSGKLGRAGVSQKEIDRLRGKK